MLRDKELNWAQWFVNLAEYVAQRSKDPSTKTGAVIARPDRTVASLGYNGFPRGIDDNPVLLNNREEKYKRIVHCEMNAILNAREPLHGYSLYGWPGPSCDRCAVHIIQAGIKRVVSPEPSRGFRDRWKESMDLAQSLFWQAGVEVIYL